ncbi:MAG TPA: 16S rRNA (cytidine(1402)-2'-O)-methyltransferase [Chloroflexota bacterium]|nr:16S rRNA (cytidine(1402)-2'-O)-methyltransferase [Chloroflexota bacterium]
MNDADPLSSAASDGDGKGTLYVVSTPIGNLGDVSLRALETLRRVRLIAAEDTRHTRKLLTHHGISARLVSYHAHNRLARIDEILAQLAHGHVALVSDAGTPVVSDPGQELVRAAADAGYAVVCVPGASALTAALAVSGLEASVVHFGGFLPRRQSERRRALAAMRAWPGVAVVFEAPHRLRSALEDVLAELGDVPLAVCCDLTKRFESVFRGVASEAGAHFAEVEPRGEFTLVVALPGAPPDERAAPAPQGTHDLEARFDTLRAALGDRARALAALARESGLPRKELYRRLISGRRSDRD